MIIPGKLYKAGEGMYWALWADPDMKIRVIKEEECQSRDVKKTESLDGNTEVQASVTRVQTVAIKASQLKRGISEK